MSSRVLLIGRSGSGKTSLIFRIHNKAYVEKFQADSDFHIVNKTQAAIYHPGFIDVPGEYLELRSLYRALIMLTCESCAISLVQAANDSQSLFPSGLARVFDKPVIGVVTKTDVDSANPKQAEEILRKAGASDIFFTSALNNEGIDDLIKHLDLLRTAKAPCGMQTAKSR